MQQKRHLETINETENMIIWDDRDCETITLAMGRLSIMLDYEEFEELKTLISIDYEWHRDSDEKKVLKVNFNPKDN